MIKGVNLSPKKNRSKFNMSLKFELKNQLIKSFQKFLFKNHLEEFERKLVEHFYKYSKKSFVLDTCYTDFGYRLV